MNHDVLQLAEPFQQPILDLVRQPVRLVEAHVGPEPDVQIQEGVIR